jgi:hypothetical protein
MKTWKTTKGVSLLKVDGYTMFAFEDWNFFRWYCFTPDNEPFDYSVESSWPNTMRTAQRQAIKAMEIHKSRQ